MCWRSRHSRGPSERLAIGSGRGDADWRAVDRDLEARFGEKYRRLRSGVHPTFLKVAEASPAGLVQVLDLLAVGANGALARIAAASEAIDDPTVRAAAEWQPPMPPNPFESPDVRGQLDLLKATDPVVGDRIANALGGPLGLLGRSTDEEANERIEAERMKAFAQSPETLEFVEQQKQLMETMKAVNPEVARFIRHQLDEMEQIASDPAGFRAEWAARTEAEDARAAEEGDGSTPPPGRFRFDCGGVKRPTEHQKRLFTRLVERQEELAPKVEQALRAMHAEMADEVDLDDPQERVLFSEEARASDVPLDYFRVESFILPESGDRIGMSFESIFGHEEHGCALVIEADEVTDFGDTEVLFALEDDEDEYDDDEDEDEA